ncbi:TRAP transporter small permease subunit [Melioribacteraceae bacterium 4301-Me]|uniref:TRAP transporter small permease subunit n=1 Tax=Pyranulibacter aquaticus TaxID=3163344 RepID=UPI00359A9B43
MNFINKYIKAVDKLNSKIGIGVSYLTALLVIVVCYDVVTRYFFKSSSVAIQELEWHLFAVIFLLGGGYTLLTENHVRVDIIYVRLSEKKKAWINILGTFFFLIPFSLMILYTSWNFVENSFLISETSPDPGGLPARFIIKSILPIAFVFILLQGISLLFKSILIVAGKFNTKEN